MQAKQGSVQLGGQKVVTQGISSTTSVQTSYPGATVTVFNRGTTTLASIFSDNIGTALSNPFTSSAINGDFIFYAANGRYDVQLSGAGMPATETIPDILLNDPSGNTAITGNLTVSGTFVVAGVSSFADGTAAAPSITFTNNSNRGIFNDTANGGVGIAVGGVQIAAIGSAGAAFNGSVGVPASKLLVFTSGNFLASVDTGISRLGAASLAFGNGFQGDFSATAKAANFVSTAGLQQGTATTGMGLVDFNGVSHLFISGTAPYTNTFLSGNGSGVVFLGTAGKTSVDDITGIIVMSGSTSGTTQIKPSAIASGVLTLPAATDTLVGKATTDTLTNKTLTAPVISSISNTGVLTLPASTDTLVGRATTDTLTNKTVGSGGLAGLTPKQTNFLVNGTFTIPAGVTAVKVTVVGGGGAGGGSTATNNGGGGGSGAVAVKWLSGLTPGLTIAVTVGAGGVGVSAAGGNNGANSIIASGTQAITTVTAFGGFGGASTGAPSAGGGAGTQATNGDINSGGNGGTSAYASTIGGTGGAGPFGGAGQSASASAGNAASGPGAGGGGAGAAGNAAGGSGAAGIVLFEYVI